MKKILIIQTAFLGDCILASSVLETLHNKVFKNAKIDLLLRKGNENVYLNHPYLNNLYIWDKKKNKYKNLFKILKIIRGENYDVVFNLQRFFSTGLLTFLSKAKCKINFNKNPFSILSTISVKHNISNLEKKLEYIHEIDRNHKLVTAYLKYLKIEKNVLVSMPKLYPSIIEYKKILKILNDIYINLNKTVQQNINIKINKTTYKDKFNFKYICIVPCSVWFTKQYPIEKWLELINFIKEDKIFLLGSKDDYIFCEEILKKSKNKNIYNLSGNLSILETAVLMQNAKVNYVNDSAALHIASSMNANVISIFCSTIPSFGFYPLSTKNSIVQIKEKLECRPCTSHGKKFCPLGHYDCAYKINVKDLLVKL